MGKKKKKKKRNLKTKAGDSVPTGRSLSLEDVQEDFFAQFQAGRFVEAEQILREVLKNKPNDERVHNNLGSMLLKQGKFDEAFVCYRQAIELRPTYAEAHYNFGNGLKDVGRLEEAVSCYQKALKNKSDYWEAHSNQGDVLTIQGKLEEAVSSYQAALEVNSDRAETHNQLGNAFLAQGRFDDAARSFRRAIEIKPDYSKPYYYLHSLLYRDSDLAPAADFLEKAVRADPEFQMAIFYLGVIRDQQGETAAASDLFARLRCDENGYNSHVDSWNYVKSRRSSSTRFFGVVQETLRYCLGQCRMDGLVLEFGVRYGLSLRLIAKETGDPVYGFDSFEGLPERWHNEPKGSYTTHGELPEVPPNVQLHAGWFDKTLPTFVAEHEGPVRFLHVDCDLYSSAKTIFDHLGDRIIPGTVIVFDDYLMNETWRNDEFKAFQEACEEYRWEYEYIAFSMFGKQAGVLIN